MSDDPEQLDDLLARGRLGGPRRDRILSRVLASTESPVRQARWRFKPWIALFPAVGVTCAAAVFLLVRPASPPEEFRAKGAGQGVGVAISAMCGHSDLGICSPGDRIAFKVNRAPYPQFLIAYADPLDSSLPRIWIFPDRDGRLPKLRPSVEPYVLEIAAVVSPDHPAGTYRIVTVASDRELTRQEVLANPPSAPETAAVITIK